MIPQPQRTYRALFRRFLDQHFPAHRKVGRHRATDPGLEDAAKFFGIARRTVTAKRDGACPIMQRDVDLIANKPLPEHKKVD